jgi:D-glycero-D-manno-heptose 1,7-bisphosphate phosphatase
MIINGHNVYIRPGFRPKKNWAVFLDRDGVINKEKKFAFKLKDLVLVPEIIPALKRLNQQQIPVIVVHNAAAAARNLCRLEDVEKFNRHLINKLLGKNVFIDALFYCPHHPTAFNPQYKKDCSWHKPGSGMLTAAAKKFRLDLSLSFLIGDQERDIEAARTAGVTAYLINHGQDILNAVDKII